MTKTPPSSYLTIAELNFTSVLYYDLCWSVQYDLLSYINIITAFVIAFSWSERRSPRLHTVPLYASSDGFPASHINSYRPQTKFAKVMFLHLSVILSTGGGSASVHAGIPPPQSRHPPGTDTPPGTDAPPGTDTPWDQTHTHTPGVTHPPGADTSPGTRHTPREPRRLLLRTVRILQWRIQYFPGMRGGGVPTPEEVRQTVILQSFFPRKLHENERIWTKKGARIPGAPLDSPLVSLPV